MLASHIIYCLDCIIDRYSTIVGSVSPAEISSTMAKARIAIYLFFASDLDRGTDNQIQLIIAD